MGARNDMVQAVRQWLINSFSPALSDSVVLKEPFRGDRPAVPYLSVRVLAFMGNASSTPDRLEDDRTAWSKTSTVRVQAFGEDMIDNLNIALDKLGDQEELAAIHARGYVITADSSVQDLSLLLDTDEELRAFVDLQITCTQVSDPVTLVDTTTIGLDTTLQDQDPDPDPYTITVETGI